jgi:hypothetical protein
MAALILLSVSALCHGADNGPYVGGAVGTSVEIEAEEDVGADSGDPNFKLFAGIGLGRNLALEIAYHDFGSTTCCGPSYADIGFERSGDGFSATAVALWPITSFRLFARAGALWWDVDGYDLTIIGRRPYSNDGVDFTAGLGGDVAVAKKLRIRLEWEFFTIDGEHTDAVTIGALWQF